MQKIHSEIRRVDAGILAAVRQQVCNYAIFLKLNLRTFLEPANILFHYRKKHSFFGKPKWILSKFRGSKVVLISNSGRERDSTKINRE